MVTLQLSSNLTPPTFQTKLLKPAGFNQSHHRQPSLKRLPPWPSFSVLSSQQPTVHNEGVAAIVFGDGESETGLYPLTKRRSKGAIPIAANYRLVDAVISNCINSKVNKIYAITQFNSTSLNSHLLRAYSGGVGLGKEGIVEVIAAYQSSDGLGWFQGTADSIRRCLWVFEEHPVAEYLVLPGHHLYRMNYQKVVEVHRKSGADITVVALSSTRDHDPAGYGLLDVDTANQVTRFRIQPRNGNRPLITVENAGRTEAAAVIYTSVPSTGIYVIGRDRLVELLNEFFPQTNDFGAEIVPGAMSIGMKVSAYMFNGYWENMKSIGAFYRANMDSFNKSGKSGGYDFYDIHSPFYTLPRCLPPSTVGNAVITDSFIGDGCILDSCNISGSVLGMRTRVESGVVIEDSVIMGSNVYEDADQANGGGGRRTTDAVPIGIGRGTRIKKAIVDKNARIGKNVTIVNRDKVEEGDRESEGYVISEGIVVVLRGAMIPDRSVL